MTRRQLLRAAMAASSYGLASGFGRLGMLNAYSGALADYRALVCVFLFGGNDSNNLLVPRDSAQFQAYTAIRQNLALAASDLDATQLQAADGTSYSLHPDLSALVPAFTQKKLAVVANAGSLIQPVTRDQFLNGTGTPNNLFSHLDQQTQWQTSIAQGQSVTGWAGRVADAVAPVNSPSNYPVVTSVADNTIFGVGASTYEASVIPGAAIGLQGFSDSTGDQARLSALTQLVGLTSDATLIQAAQSKMSDAIRDSNLLNRALTGAPALTQSFPSTSIGKQLAETASLIQVRQDLQMSRQIFFCSLGGFDTHTNQLDTQSGLYAQLGPAMAAFSAQMDEWGISSQVTLFTASDFSRTFKPNTNGGSDHAWGGHHLVLGGAVAGGQVYGQLPVFALNGDQDAGSEGRWIPGIAVDQYGATLAQWLGVTPAQLPTVFPNLKNFQTQNLGFLGA